MAMNRRPSISAINCPEDVIRRNFGRYLSAKDGPKVPASTIAGRASSMVISAIFGKFDSGEYRPICAVQNIPAGSRIMQRFDGRDGQQRSDEQSDEQLKVRGVDPAQGRE